MNIHTKRCFVRSMPETCITGNVVEAYLAAASRRNALLLLGHGTKYTHHASLDVFLAAHFCGSTFNIWMFLRGTAWRCLQCRSTCHTRLWRRLRNGGPRRHNQFPGSRYVTPQLVNSPVGKTAGSQDLS